MKGLWRTPFYQRFPEISLAGFILGLIWGSIKVKENPLSPGIVQQLQIICSKIFRGAENVNCGEGEKSLKEAQQSYGPSQGMRNLVK